ncbi:unnamed protein product [Candidula unifasciata]|uniref:RING-type domain-containing protein n=1 Tax=Candidula unifasciata TaxID=100452 RepID=A0A8S3Z2G7_9EUPU|nr:unnamed protein product [Candidula unifasciata]
MLQTFLIVAVPALVTLTAALYVLHRVSRAREEMHRPPHFQTRPGKLTSGDSTVTSRRTGGGSESGPYKGDCVVCFEESNIVQLYPCLHRSLCEECVIKIVSSNRRICPLCRTRIQGYGDDF